MKNTLACLLLLFSAVACSADNRVTAFSDLPKGDTIAVRYSSLGCFHSFTYELLYSPQGDGSFEVHEVQSMRSTPTQRQPKETRTFRGRITLGPGEAKKLDSMIAFYRTNSNGGCTTTDSVRLRQIRRGRTLAEESFVDASCATFSQPDLLTFSHLIAALTTK